jgi:hypothetical protein
MNITAIDLALKAVQITFYLSAIVVAWLTYRSAKRGLLSAVNTEYHRRVIDRLHVVSLNLWSEFEDHPLGLIAVFAAEISERTRRREGVPTSNVALGYDAGSMPRFAGARRLGSLYMSLVADPFVPSSIRERVCAFLKHRIWAMSVAAEETLKEFAATEDDGFLDDRILAATLERMERKGYGPRDTRKTLRALRERIQLFLQSFDPMT